MINKLIYLKQEFYVYKEVLLRVKHRTYQKSKEKMIDLLNKTETKLYLILLTASICLNYCLQPSRADTTEIKEIKFGRKDLIRNDLIKSNNEIFKTFIESQNLQINSLNKAVFIWQDEFKRCQALLERCKCK